MMTETDDTIRAVRAFNRFHTRFAGALAPRYMGSDMSLIEARLFYEIIHREGLLAAELQARLDLDAGYASRLLRRFEAEGWIERRRGAEDARQRPIHVTAAGRAAYEALDAVTRADVAARLAPIGVAGRKALVEALGTARMLLADSDLPPWTMRSFETGDMGRIATRQAELYAALHGWGRPMEALLLDITGRFLRDFQPGREQCWVAERGGRMVGSVFVCDSGERGAQLRLLYVEPEARGLGIGEALVNTAIGFAREAGYDQIWLWTHSVLESARRIYAGCGFVRTAMTVHHAFGAPQEGEDWELRFRD